MIYVVRGKARLRWGERLEYVAEAGPGDFIYVPPYVPHQEINADPDQVLECVLVRSDNEAVVVNITDVDPVEAPESVYWSIPSTRPPHPEGDIMSNRITAAELSADLSGIDLLIDVRAPKGRAENGEIASAVILPKPLVAEVFAGPLASVPKDARIVVFCGSVNGSGPVVGTLAGLGFTNVADVEGGYAALKERGVA